MIEEWKVIVDPADPEVMAVEGAYLVARNLPIEDARLISAAPDLYEALERIVQSVARTTSGDVCQTFDFDDARRALAKARGEDAP